MLVKTVSGISMQVDRSRYYLLSSSYSGFKPFFPI